MSLQRTQAQNDGAFYPAIVHGNQRSRTFHDDQDQDSYLECLECYHQRCGLRLFAWVLMSNQVHFHLEANNVPVSEIMQGIQFRYTQRYNRPQREVDPVSRPYKAIVRIEMPIC
ncbi:MAG: transposase [Candidatus Binatia bacterium]